MEHNGKGWGPGHSESAERLKTAQVVAVAAVGAAAVSLLAGIGTYLFIRFTQRGNAPSASRNKSQRARPERSAIQT